MVHLVTVGEQACVRALCEGERMLKATERCSVATSCVACM
jgi:hypothetical protein